MTDVGKFVEGLQILGGAPSGVVDARSLGGRPAIVLAGKGGKDALSEGEGLQPSMNKGLQDLYLSINCSLSNMVSAVTRTKEMVGSCLPSCVCACV